MAICAVDVGYRFVKATKDGRTVDIFPSVLAPSYGSTFESKMFNARSFEIEVSGKRFLIGEDAEKGSESSGQTIDRRRTESDEYLILVLASLVRLFPHGMSDVRMVTGLPNSEMDDEKLVRDRILGKHNVRVNGKQVGYEISKVEVVPQSFGTLIAEAFDFNGNLSIKREDLLTKPSLHFDVGGRTINLMRFVGKRYIKDLSGSVPQGMYRVLQRLRPVINERFRVQYTLNRIDEILKSGYIELYGERKPIDSLVSPFLDDLANKALQDARSLWGEKNIADSSRVLIAGGGAHKVGYLIQQKINHPNAVVVREPQTSNVRGYYIYAFWLDKSQEW